MGTWILLAWVVIAVMMVILWRIENSFSKETAGRLRRTTGFLSLVNLVFAVLLMIYSGVLPAVSSKVLWAGTVLLPALFVASAVSMGLAILIIAILTVNATNKGGFAVLKPVINQTLDSTDWTIPSRTVPRIAMANAIVIIIELAALIGHILWLTISAEAGAGEAIELFITGTLAVPFWLGVVLLALLIPLALYVINWGKDIETGTVERTMAISSICVVFGGLLLRAVIMVGGQIMGT
jgi:formate-dependent nitrite reductase membrane component NrfD